jgi:hypothetical protein
MTVLDLSLGRDNVEDRVLGLSQREKKRQNAIVY